MKNFYKKIIYLSIFFSFLYFVPQAQAACTSSNSGDLPGWGSSVTLSSCNKTISGVTGVDWATAETSTVNSGALTLTSSSLTINSGGVLNVGSLTMGSGSSISIDTQGNGKVQIGSPLYIADADNDGWASAVLSSATLYEATGSGKRRLAFLRGWTVDCGDSSYSTANACNTYLVLDHETNNLTQYTTSTTDSGDLSVTAGAALNGTSYGLSVNIDDGTGIYGTKTINKTTTYRERFYLDPNSLTMANNDSFIYHQINQATGSQMLTTSLKYLTATGYQLVMQPKTDAGTDVVADTKNITDAPHYIEFNMVRAATSSSVDGQFEWWVDGVSQGSWTNIDNYNLFEDQATWSTRWGMYAGRDAGTSGTFYLDEMVANDTGTQIGP